MINVRSPDVCGKSFYELHEEQAHKYVVAVPITANFINDNKKQKKRNICTEKERKEKGERGEFSKKTITTTTIGEMCRKLWNRRVRVFTLCPADNFQTARRFVTKLGMIVHHHEPECHAKGLGCYLQGQGHNEGLIR